jgi:Flp pilus assembly protein protease CpaA
MLVAAVMLLGASIWDMRERRVPNLYWFPYAAIAGIFVISDIYGGEWLHLIGATVVASLSYLFWRFGLWGGADAKGVMILSFLVSENLQGTTVVAVLDVLVAGMLLVLVIPIGLTVWNLSKNHRAFPAMFIGSVMPIEIAKQRRVWPLQNANGWRLRSRIGEDLRLVYRELELAGKTHVWTTMQLPLMVFLLAGLIIVNLIGSPMGWLQLMAGQP